MARARTLAPTWNLVGPFRLSDALVDWLAAGEPFAHTVPMCDCFFAEPPAEQDGPSIHNARKVEQTDIEVFDLHADGIDFRDGILHALYGLFALGLAPREMHDIQERATIEENSVGDFLQFSIDGFDQLLAINRSAEKRLEHREQGLRFFESERTVSHKRYVDILIHFGRCGAGTLVRESDMNPVFAVQGQLAMLTAYRSSLLSLQTAHVLTR